MHATTTPSSLEQLTTMMCEQMATLTRTLGTWMQENPPTLAEVEHHVVRLLKELGASLVASVCALAVPAAPPSTVPCGCGQAARFVRLRPAHVTTLLGPIALSRPYYLCAACGHGLHPLDAQLQLCAGSQSVALTELLALLGATQDSFAEAAAILDRLTLIQLAPNTVRQATEHLGAALLAEQRSERLTESAHPASCKPTPKRLYITMDGVLVHLHETGWSELKLGCLYQTETRRSQKQPETSELHAQSACYTTTLACAHTFGWYLWEKAVRCGLLAADEVVVVADGAHWIWNIAETHFPRATQIVDWYHASAYIWTAANAIWGETGAERLAWAKRQEARLWQGEVAAVLDELAQWREKGEGVKAALSYYTTHQQRMQYALYRACGLQIGSGSVESGCKQVVQARLKQAGMIWNASGAEAVALVRAWLKSGRWDEAVALRGVRRRGYTRKQARGEQKNCQAHKHPEPPPVTLRKARGNVLSAEVLAQVQRELAEQRGKNVWNKTKQPAHGQERGDPTAVPRPTGAA